VDEPADAAAASEDHTLSQDGIGPDLAAFARNRSGKRAVRKPAVDAPVENIRVETDVAFGGADVHPVGGGGKALDPKAVRDQGGKHQALQGAVHLLVRNVVKHFRLEDPGSGVCPGARRFAAAGLLDET